MTTAHWSQLGRAERGVNVDAYQNDDDLYDYHEDDSEEPEEQYCCSGCMDCLGFSWRDFM